MSYKFFLSAILTGTCVAAFCTASIAQNQIEGPDLNQNITTSKGGKILILRKGRMSNLMSGTSGDQRPVFVVNYKTAFGPQDKAKMAQEANEILPSLKGDLAEGYSGLMICPYADTDKGASPYDMFMYEENTKHVWKSMTPVKGSGATKAAKPSKTAKPSTSTEPSIKAKPKTSAKPASGAKSTGKPKHVAPKHSTAKPKANSKHATNAKKA